MVGRTPLLAACLAFTANARAADPPRPDIMGKLKVPSQSLDVFGQRMVYYEAGSGRALVLLSTLGWDSNAWSQNLPELAKQYRVFALDLVGTGQSAKPLIDFKMDTWTDFIAEFLRLKGIGKATIVGAVMGGALSVQFALDHPEISEGVVCAASNSGPGTHEGGAKTTTAVSLAGQRRNLLLNFHDKALITEEIVRTRFEDVLRAGNGYTIQRHLADHRAPYSVDELARIRVPTQFIWCRQDVVTPLSWGEDFAAGVPGAKLAVIEGCGHLPNMEKPQEFNRVVLEFLAAHKASSAGPATTPKKD